MDAIRILLVTDFTLVRDGLRAVLERQPDLVICDEPSDAESAVRVAREARPDVILLDLHSTGQGNLQAASQILGENPSAKMIAVLGSPDLELLLKVMRVGVRGFLMKDTQVDALAQAIRSVAKGGAVIDPRLAATMLSDYQRLVKQSVGGGKDGYSSRDLEMLRCLARGEGNRQIAGRMFLSEQTVKNELSEIYRRLGVENRTEAVAAAVRMGLISLNADQEDF